MFSSPAPWMSPDPDPHPADSSPEHARALELLAAVVAAETVFNNPDLADPDSDIDPSAEVPELARFAAEADRRFVEHLTAHRAVLGTHPRWALQYELIDTPEDGHPSGDPEWFRNEEPEYIDDEEGNPL